MMSVFSDACPKSVKVEHAFRIFDIDNDDLIGKDEQCKMCILILKFNIF